MYFITNRNIINSVFSNDGHMMIKNWIESYGIKVKIVHQDDEILFVGKTGNLVIIKHSGITINPIEKKSYNRKGYLVDTNLIGDYLLTKKYDIYDSYKYPLPSDSFGIFSGDLSSTKEDISINLSNYIKTIPSLLRENKINDILDER